MVNLVSVDGQHQGVYGFPGCPPGTLEFCDTLLELLEIAYLPGIQDRLVQAQYWHDPIQVDLHRRSSQYIGPINNEVREGASHVEEYKTNLNKLENLGKLTTLATSFELDLCLVLCMGDRDVTVLPRETSHFGFFKYGTDDELLPMDQTEVYVNDQLGLKQMNEAGKIKFYTHKGGHMNFSTEWFVQTCIPYLQ